MIWFYRRWSSKNFKPPSSMTTHHSRDGFFTSSFFISLLAGTGIWFTLNTFGYKTSGGIATLIATHSLFTFTVVHDESWKAKVGPTMIIAFIEAMIVFIGTLFMSMFGNSPFIWTTGTNTLSISWQMIWNAYLPLIAIVVGSIMQRELDEPPSLRRRPDFDETRL